MVRVRQGVRSEDAALVNLSEDGALVDTDLCVQLGDLLTFVLEGRTVACAVSQIRGRRLGLQFLGQRGAPADDPWSLPKAA